jgi:chitodextrinase
MRSRFIFSFVIFSLLFPIVAFAANSVSLNSVETYGNFHVGGVAATITGDDDWDASAELLWRQVGEAFFRTGHPLVRIDATHFVGSLFWLEPNTNYEVQVVLSDPDGVNGSPSPVTSLDTRSESLPEPSTRTLYVATGGNDANPGTNSGTPLRTIQRAADLSQPGDLILIQPGVYRESVSVPRSGTASQPIVFRGNGAGVILDGADETIASGVTWTPSGNGVYSRVTGFPTDHVVTEAGRLYRYNALSDLQALGAGAPGGFYFDGTQLSVKFADASSPAAHTMQVARLEDGLVLDGVSYVRIENLEIRNYGSEGYGKGIYLRYCSDIVVRYCQIHEVERAGVWVKGGDRHRIEDNEFWDTSIFNWPWSLSKGSTAENNGIRFTDEAGRGHVMRRNTIHGTFNGIGIDSGAVPASGVTNEIDVYENIIYQQMDDAFEPEGPYTSNFRFWSNYVEDVHMAFSLAPVGIGPVWVIYNVVYRQGNTPSSLSDATFLKINNGYSTDNGPIFLYHNTVFTDAPSTDAIRIMEPAQSPLITLRNNILAGTLYVLEIDPEVQENLVGLDMNGDDLYTTDTTRLIKWFNNIKYTNLGTFRSGTGQELQGLSAQPTFVNPAGGDFRLPAGSALIDAGVLIPGINDDYVGNGPDIGAYEYGLGDTTPPTVPTNLTATLGSLTQINLSWTASTDNVGVTGYQIYRDGSQIATTAGTSYQDTGLSPDLTYTYRVAAYDAAGNVSGLSNEVSFSIVDRQIPVISNVASSGITSTGATITWTTNEITNGGVSYGLTNYEHGASDPSWGTNHSVVLSGLTASTTYHYQIWAMDQAANNAESGDYTFTTAAPPDTQAPTVPKGLTATTVSSSQINLSWSASSDNVGVAGYKIYRDDTQIAATVDTSYQSAGLNASTRYSYRVAAYDEAGNTSAKSMPSTATTEPSQSTMFTIGDRVQTTSRAIVLSVPSDSGAVSGTQPRKAIGRVVGGPCYWNLEWWWQIDFDRGTDGWVAEGKLKEVLRSGRRVR